MTSKYSKVAILLAFVLVLALGLAACGGGSESTSGGGTTSEASETVSAGSGTAAAKKAIAPFVGHPSAFPVTEPMKQDPAGTSIVDVECGTPFCGLLSALHEEAAKVLGMDLTLIKSGASASAVSSAFDSAVSQEPDSVITAGINPELFRNQLKELQEKEVPVASHGLINAKEYGMIPSVDGELQFERDGSLMANYVIAEYGPESNIVWYDVPELPFTPVEEASFNETIAKNCPGCSVRKTDIGVETIGNTAPSQVVSDLQANPDTDVAVFSVEELQIGLPAALQAAGISIKTMGLAPGPTNLQYLQEGKETAALAEDAPVQAWTAVDEVGRLVNGQELTGDEAKGISDLQFLTQKDITFDTSKGWTGYPDYAARFEKLWGAGG
ncbi:MAG TPA: substrate-binding domain-containing protein [Solirubrobacterales bacterium]